MASALEKKYQETRTAAITEAEQRYPENNGIIVSFGDHDCIVDVLVPSGTDNPRFVYVPEED